MDQDQRQALIQQYRDGHRVLAAALAGTTDAELDAPPPDGGWTARQVVHHVPDSEMTSAIRLRRLVAEDRPELNGYDEEQFARRLYYDRPIAASLEAVRAVRAVTAELLDRLSPEEWAREGSHDQHDAYSVEVWLEIYAAHCHDHAEQIKRALSAARIGATATPDTRASLSS
jgi:hypothetical protein